MIETADLLREFYKDSPKLLDTWLMVGYRQWLKRSKGKPTKEKAANKKLESLALTPLDVMILAADIKRKIGG